MSVLAPVSACVAVLMFLASYYYGLQPATSAEPALAPASLDATVQLPELTLRISEAVQSLATSQSELVSAVSHPSFVSAPSVICDCTASNSVTCIHQSNVQVMQYTFGIATCVCLCCVMCHTWFVLSYRKRTSDVGCQTYSSELKIIAPQYVSYAVECSSDVQSVSDYSAPANSPVVASKGPLKVLALPAACAKAAVTPKELRRLRQLGCQP